MQVVDSVLREINCHPDKEVDLVFINNRSARWLSDSFERCLPPINKFLVPFGEFEEFIKESRKNSPAIWDGVNSRIFGGDAYLLTSTGLQKLFKFVHEHGIYPLGGENLDVGIEKYLCNWLSTSVEDNGIAGRPTSLAEIHFSSDRPYLNTYVARFPFSISLQELSFDICHSQTSFSK